MTPTNQHYNMQLGIPSPPAPQPIHATASPLPPSRLNVHVPLTTSTSMSVPVAQPPVGIPGLSSVMSNSLLAGLQQGRTTAAQQPQQQVLPPRPASQPLIQGYPPQYVQQQQQQQYPYYPQQPAIACVPMGAPASMPQYIPQNFVVPGQQVGSPLSNPETMDGQGWWKMTGWSLLRGGLKGAGLALINIVDHIQFGPLFRGQ